MLPLELSSPPAPALTQWLADARRPTTNTYWHDQGLAHQYHTFAAILQQNYVSPHQVILDADIDHFGHPDAGPALMHAAVKFPAEPPSDNDSA